MIDPNYATAKTNQSANSNRWHLSDIEYSNLGTITTHIRLVPGGALVRTIVGSSNKDSNLSVVFIPNARFELVVRHQTASETYYELRDPFALEP